MEDGNDNETRLDEDTARAEAEIVQSIAPTLKKETQNALPTYFKSLPADSPFFLELGSQHLYEMKKSKPQYYESIIEQKKAFNELTEEVGVKMADFLSSKLNSTSVEKSRTMNWNGVPEILIGASVAEIAKGC
jgi:hypothetical protein